MTHPAPTSINMLNTKICIYFPQHNSKHLFTLAQSVKNLCNAGDLGLIPGSQRYPGEGDDNPPQYSCLENPMDREAWKATVHGVTRVGHNLGTKPPPPIIIFNGCLIFHGIDTVH